MCIRQHSSPYMLAFIIILLMVASIGTLNPIISAFGRVNNKFGNSQSEFDQRVLLYSFSVMNVRNKYQPIPSTQWSSLLYHRSTFQVFWVVFQQERENTPNNSVWNLWYHHWYDEIMVYILCISLMKWIIFEYDKMQKILSLVGLKWIPQFETNLWIN